MQARGTITAIVATVVIATTGTACDSTDGSGGAGSACAPDCPVRTVSQSLGPRQLAVDATDVFWVDGFNSNDQSIRRAPRAGGDAATLAKGADSIHDLVIDATHVYFSEGGKLQRVAKSGGTVETLADKESGIAGLALADGQLFWTGTNGLRTLPTSGGQAKTIASGTYAGTNYLFRVVVDATHAYWANNGDIFRAPRAGGDPIKLRAGPGSVYDLALDGGTLYFAMGGLSSDKGVYSVSKDGGTPTVVATSEGNVEGIALDGGTLYWSDTDGGQVMGPGGPIAKSTRPSRLVVVSGELFWTDSREAGIKSIGP